MKFRIRFIDSFLFISIGSLLLGTSFGLFIGLPIVGGIAWINDWGLPIINWRHELIWYLKCPGVFGLSWGLLWAIIIHYFAPVTVDEDGLSCSTFWGITNRTAKWSSITHCKYLNTLGFKTLRIFYSNSRWALWLNLHLEHNEEFMAAVKKYAGEGSELYSSLIKYNA
jgi:hypothetical protein